MIKNKNIVIIGSSSELAKEFINSIEKDNIVFQVSRNIESNEKSIRVNDYSEDLDKIIFFIKNISNPILVCFNGYIAENRPIQYPSNEDVEKTININFLTPYKIIHRLITNNVKYNKITLISSFAAIKPRFKNFIYGYSKKLLEDSVLDLSSKNILIIRFGKINTKMSSSHSKNFLELDKKKASSFLYKNIEKEDGIIYSSSTIRLIAFIVKILPIKLLKRLKL